MCARSAPRETGTAGAASLATLLHALGEHVVAGEGVLPDRAAEWDRRHRASELRNGWFELYPTALRKELSHIC